MTRGQGLLLAGLAVAAVAVWARAAEPAARRHAGRVAPPDARVVAVTEPSGSPQRRRRPPRRRIARPRAPTPTAAPTSRRPSRAATRPPRRPPAPDASVARPASPFLARMDAARRRAPGSSTHDLARGRARPATRTAVRSDRRRRWPTSSIASATWLARQPAGAPATPPRTRPPTTCWRPTARSPTQATALGRRDRARRARAPSADLYTAVEDATRARPRTSAQALEAVVVPGLSDPRPPTRHIATRQIVAVRGDGLEVRDDRVVGEAPLEIRAAGPGQEPVAVAVTMRTPGHEAELAVGFLRTEGLIDGPGGRVGRAGRPGDAQPARRHHRRPPVAAVRRLGRRGAALRRDGLVRDLRQGLDRRGRRALRRRCRTARSSRARSILALPDALRAAQRAFDETGGLHAAALFTPDRRAHRHPRGRRPPQRPRQAGRVAAPRRRAAAPRADPDGRGRVRFEIVQKAAVAGVPIVCAVSAPSDLAIETAERLGVTLVGFLRGDGFNVYSPRPPHRPARPDRLGLTPARSRGDSSANQLVTRVHDDPQHRPVPRGRGRAYCG